MRNRLLHTIRQALVNQYVLLGARLVLGATFILAAVAKLPEQAKFVDQVTGYGLLPLNLAQVYGSVLPWLELVVGICLVLGLLTRFAAGVSIMMIASFIAANGTAVFKNVACPCFGDFFLMKTSDALLVDVVIIGMATLILLHGGGFLSLGWITRAKSRKSAPSIRG